MHSKGQFSIELFLVLGLFIVMLFWLGNYYQQFSSSDALAPQRAILARQIASLASEANASGTQILFDAPCFTLKGSQVPFWTRADGNGFTILSVATADNPQLDAGAFSTHVSTPFKTRGSPTNVTMRFDCAGNTAGKIGLQNDAVDPSFVLVSQG